jgi:hypothetical protein
VRCNDPTAVGLVPRETKFGTLWGWPGPAPDKAAQLAEQRAASA